MALEIKIINKPDNRKVVRVVNGGTIFQLFRQIKKAQRDHKKFLATHRDESIPMWIKTKLFEKWQRNQGLIHTREEPSNGEQATETNQETAQEGTETGERKEVPETLE